MNKDTSEPQNNTLAPQAAQQEAAPKQSAAPAKSKKPKEKGGVKRFFGAIGGFFKKHKVLGVLLIIIVLIAALVLRGCAAVNAAAKAAGAYSFVRTTTLTKGDLTSTVSCTGTVESADTSTVTYASASTAVLPKFKTVNVAVGDTVQAGDVIATLDTADIEKSIAKEKENIADQVSKAQTSYNRAVENYNKAVADYNTQKTERDADLQILVEARQALKDAGGADAAALQAAQDASAKASQDTANASTTLLSSLTAVQSALTAANITTTYTLALPANSTDTSTKATLDQINLQYGASGQVSQNPGVGSAVDAANIALSSYQSAQAVSEQAAQALSTLQSAASQTSSNLTALQQKEQTADSAYEAADKQLQSLSDQVSTAKNTMDDAKTTLDKASESDTLDNLNDQLKDCSLTAETSGKVTALNASVGATPSGTIATIQDVDNLKISITVAEADINSIQEGMACQITTDATEGTIQGKLTQINPVAGDSAKFGAEVTVTDTDTALKIGMNATVKIILSSTADCFTVPIDAIGNDNDGQGDYVYRSTGGQGVDMTFEKVSVTTGESNDYYIEISSDQLAEGDIIRSSSDLTQGIVSATDAASSAAMEGGEVTVATGDAPADGGQGGPNGGPGGAPAGGQ